MLKLILDDGAEFTIKLFDNPVAENLRRTIKHLQSIRIPFSPKFDKLYASINDRTALIDLLLESAGKLNISVDITLLDDQEYLNSLHKIYEQGYNQGSNVWLDFHEMIHAIEGSNLNKIPAKEITINYRDKAGPLEKPFDRTYLKFMTSQISKGTCYAYWGELGKTVESYWADGEPEDVQRICQLAKPWTILRPTFKIALEDNDLSLTADRKERIIKWFAQYEAQWKKHWNVNDWTVDEMSSVIPLGTIAEVDLLSKKIDEGKIPVNVVIQ